MIIAGLLFYIYKKNSDSELSFSRETAKKLLLAGKYYIISDIMVTIFAETDKIMLKNIVNSESTAYYSAALTCASLTSFVFVAILDSFRPIIFQSKKESNENYELNLVRLFSVIIYMSLIQSVLMAVFASLIISILYGSQYMQAVSALRIVVWYTTFAYLGSVRNIWILSEGKQRYLLPINGMGATLNIILNIVLIPKYGANGAAFASLITQIFTNVGTGLLLKDIRPVNTLMLKSLHPRYMFSMTKTVLNEIRK